MATYTQTITGGIAVGSAATESRTDGTYRTAFIAYPAGTVFYVRRAGGILERRVVIRAVDTSAETPYLTTNLSNIYITDTIMSGDEYLASIRMWPNNENREQYRAYQNTLR